MADRDLRLNSISRYSKESPQFILEEHGHCEVPAGCGGVVLRWTNPHRAIPLEFWIYVAGTLEFFMDGKPLVSGRPLVDYGEHVLAFRISDFNAGRGFFMFAGRTEGELIHTHLSHSTSNPMHILSAPDDSWKYSLVEPQDDSWMHTGFDETGWHSLTLKPIPLPTEQTGDSYKYEKLVEAGAQQLGIQDGQADGTVWIRRTFLLSTPRDIPDE